MIGVQLGDREAGEAGRREQPVERSHRVRVGEPLVAAGVLGQRHVGEVDDVDVEVHEQAVAARLHSGARAAAAPSGSAATSSTGTAESPRRSITSRSNAVACSGPHPNSSTSSGSSSGARGPAPTNSGTAPSSPSMCAIPIQSSAPSRTLVGHVQVRVRVEVDEPDALAGRT